MEIVKYEGFKNFFFGFVEDKENKHCFLIYSKTGTPDISMSQEEKIVRSGFNNIEVGRIPTNIYAGLSVPFRSITKFISVKDSQ